VRKEEILSHQEQRQRGLSEEPHGIVYWDRIIPGIQGLARGNENPPSAHHFLVGLESPTYWGYPRIPVSWLSTKLFAVGLVIVFTVRLADLPKPRLYDYKALQYVMVLLFSLTERSRMISVLGLGTLFTTSRRTVLHVFSRFV